MRVEFCGVIEGSVVVQPGETERHAIARAEDTINALLARKAKNLSREEEPGQGPVVGLEPA